MLNPRRWHPHLRFLTLLGGLGLAGLLLLGRGLFLLLYTDLADRGGMAGIFTVVAYLTGGVLLLVPAKVYLIVRLTHGARRPPP